MARPRKNNADYFSHDNSMRNDRKIKALRNQFGLKGYAIWCMFLEILTEAQDFKLKIDNTELELLAGDFEVETSKLREILEFLSQKLDLIQCKDKVYACGALVERLKPVIEKREFLRQKYKSRIVSTPKKVVSGVEMTQSKVKESKVNNDEQKNLPITTTKKEKRSTDVIKGFTPAAPG